MIILRLPIPPSTNGLYYNRRKGKGRGKTNHYRGWIKEADKWLLMQKRDMPPRIEGKCVVEIRLPKIRGDASNRIKAAEDFLVSREITHDDQHNRKVSVEIDEEMATRECWITVRAA